VGEIGSHLSFLAIAIKVRVGSIFSWLLAISDTTFPDDRKHNNYFNFVKNEDKGGL